MNQESAANQIATGEDMRHQIKEWKLQRIGWSLMALLILLSLLGLLGAGLLTQKTAYSDDQELAVNFMRFERAFRENQLDINLSNSTSFALNQEYLSRVSLQSILPHPDSVTTEEDYVMFEFDRPVSNVAIQYIPQKSGKYTGRLKLAQGSAVEFQQFIWP